MNELIKIPAFPLQWPVTYKRTESFKRQPSRFKVAATQARDDLFAEARRLTSRFVVSTNIPLRADGHPYADWKEPKDPGVAFYWEDGDRKRTAMACDQWRTVRENLRAVTQAIEALRMLKRCGADQVLIQVFAGLALPEHASAGSGDPPWWETLGLDPHATQAQIREAFKSRSKALHPDMGGAGGEEWERLNRAYAATRHAGNNHA